MKNKYKEGSGRRGGAGGVGSAMGNPPSNGGVSTEGEDNNADSKAGNNNDAAIFTSNDGCHNSNTPCCNLVAHITGEIFPPSIVKRYENVVRNVGGAVGDDVYVSPSTSTDMATMDGDKDDDDDADGTREKDKVVGGAPTSNANAGGRDEETLLGYMIRRHLLMERERERASGIGLAGCGGGGGGSGGGGATTTSPGAAQRKRKAKKKKKKKRKDGMAITGTTAGDGEWGSMDVNGGDDDEGESARDDDYDDVDVDCEGTTTTTMTTTTMTAIRTTATTTTSTTTTTTAVSDGTSGNTCPASSSAYLEGILDYIIDSSSTSDVRSNPHTAANRNLDLFCDHLRGKFDSHLTTSRRRNKDRSRGRGGGGGASSSKITSISINAHGSRGTGLGGSEWSDILPTISVNDMQDLSNSIDCRMCRTSAISFLRTVTSEDFYHTLLDGEGNPPPSPSKDESGKKRRRCLSIPRPKGALDDDDDDVNHAHDDYYNMNEVDLEAGKRPDDDDIIEVLDPNRLELESITPISENVRFMQIKAVVRGGGENRDSIHEYPMRTKDIINLVKHIILPCGLADETSKEGGSSSGGDEPPGNNDLATIAKDASEAVSEIQAFLTTAETSILEMKVEMGKAENSNNRSIFDVRTSTILHDCDERCGSLLKHIGAFMLRLFKSTCFVGWSLQRGHLLIDLYVHIYRRHVQALETLVTPTMNHHANVLQSASNGGAIQQAYQNKTIRDSLHSLVRKKMSTIQELVIDLRSILEGGMGTETSAVELCVLRAYRHHVEGTDITRDTIFPDQESEELMMQLIAAQINLSQKTLNSPSPDDLKKKTKDQREEFLGICRTVRKNAIAMEDFALQSKHDFLRRRYKGMEAKYYETEQFRKKNHHLGGEPISSWITDGEIEVVNDLVTLVQLSTALVLQWLPVLCARQCNESLITSLDLSPRLKTWSDKIIHMKYDKLLSNGGKSFVAEFSKSSSSNVVLDKHACSEGGDFGRRRVRSFFACLLYRWLEARCSEWHAEMTRDELIQLMENEIPGVAAEGCVKGSKKKKSNRKAGGGNKGRNKDEQASMLIVSSEATVISRTDTSATSPPSPEPFTDSISSNDAVEDDQLGVTHQNNHINNGVGDHDDNHGDDDTAGKVILQGDVTGTGGGSHNMKYGRHSVGIFEEKRSEAEMFLVKQLEMILEMESSKKCPVVWL
jgi:hypothetical protein